MTDVEVQEDLPPVAHVTIVYNGPIAPHWDLRVRYGDQKFLDDFWARVNARLLLLPKHDPQFRRNKERVNRDAERERITCDWDLGEDDADTTITPVVEPAPVEAEPAPEVAESEVSEVSDVSPEVEADVVDVEPDVESDGEIAEAGADADGVEDSDTSDGDESEESDDSTEQPAEI